VIIGTPSRPTVRTDYFTIHCYYRYVTRVIIGTPSRPTVRTDYFTIHCYYMYVTRVITGTPSRPTVRTDYFTIHCYYMYVTRVITGTPSVPQCGLITLQYTVITCMLPVWLQVRRAIPQCRLITLQYTVITRDGRIVIFCRIPDSVNRRLISSRFRIRIRIFHVTLPPVHTYKKLQVIASNALFFYIP